MGLGVMEHGEAMVWGLDGVPFAGCPSPLSRPARGLFGLASVLLGWSVAAFPQALRCSRTTLAAYGALCVSVLVDLVTLSSWSLRSGLALSRAHLRLFLFS